MPYVANTVLDQALNYIKNNATKITFVSNALGTPPTDLAQWTSDVTAAGTDFTVAQGATANDRKITYAGRAQATVDNYNNGNNTNQAVVSDGAPGGSTGALLLVTELSNAPVVIPDAPGTITVSSFEYEIKDATVV